MRPARRWPSAMALPLALDLSGFKDYALRSFLLDRLRVPETVASSSHAESAQKPEANFARAKWKAADRSRACKGPACRSLRRQPTNIASRIFIMTRPSRRWVRKRHCSAISRASVTSARSREACGTGFLPASRWATPLRPRLRGSKPARLPVSVHVRRGDYLNPGTAEVSRYSWASPITARLWPASKAVSRSERGAIRLFRRCRCGRASAEFRAEVASESRLRRPGAAVGGYGADGALPAPRDCQQLLQLVGRLA